ncbi:MAG: hypothetical protein IKA31_05095, partial [Clostridia bacterium]|nr:hypothetical protein [Clostridia bacterium]
MRKKKKLKFKDFRKKILSIICLIVTLFCNAQPIFAISSSGTAKWVAGQWDSEVFTTDNKTSVGMLMRRLVNYTTGDMYTTFCGEHFINSPTGTIETGSHSVPTDPLMKRACKVAYFGWYAKYGDYVLNGGIMASSMEQRKLDYCFTQQYIWETLGQSNATFKDSSIQSRYVAFKADVDQKITRMETRPSFVKDKITIDVGTTKTLTDTNGVLKDYNSIDKSVDGIRIVHTKGENTLQISVDKNCDFESYKITDATMESWGMIKNGTENKDTTVYITFKEGVQNQLYSLNYNDPVSMSLNLAINRFGKLEIAKQDEDGTYVPNTSFKISYNSDMSNAIGTYTTGSNGKVTIDRLEPKTIYIQEVKVPEHLILDSTIKSVTINPNETTSYGAVNKWKLGNIKINKTDSETSEPIANVTFQLIDKSGNVVQTGTTNSKGELYFYNIRVGDYKLKEISTHTNYVLNTTLFDVKVEHDKTTTKNITNDFKKGHIKINKTDAETSKGIEGVTFELQKSDGTVVATATTNSQGIANFNNIRIGEYKLKETKTNSNYILNTATFDVKVEWNKTAEKNITNEHKRGNISVFKVDKDNHKIALGNVSFDLFSYEFNKVVGTYVTNVDGEIRINNLRIGRYSLIEKNTGKWYNLSDNTDVRVEWNKTTNATIENELKKGKIKVTKVDLDNNEIVIPNVTFAVLDDNGKVLEEIITNEKGIAETSRFAIRDYATLTLKETKTDKWYVLNDKEIKVQLKENDVVNIQVENELKKGQIRVIKVDLDNNEVKLKGVEFNVLDEKGNVVDKLVTDENGEAVSKRLPINQQYKLQEVKTLQDYVLNEEIKTITLEQDKIKDITFTNELKKGQIRVIKVDLDNNEVKLKGVEFNVLDEKGNVVDKLVTDEKGEAISKRLPINQQYKLQEIKTLDNYVLNEEIKTITLKQDQITDITFTNELKKGQIRIIKVDLYNNEIKLKGVEFNLLDEDGNVIEKIVTDENGEAVSKRYRIDKQYTLQEIKTLEKYDLNEEIKTITLEQDKIIDITFTNELKKGQIRVIKVDLDNNEVKLKGIEFNVLDESGNVVDTLITDENGEAVSKLLRVNQKYTLQEIKTLENYVLNEETKVVTLQPAEITSVTFENEKIKGYIQVTKTSAEDNKYSELPKGSPLADVKFEVYDAENNLVDTITTDKEGKAITKELLKGCYKIKEITSAKYYLLNTKIYDAEIKEHQEIVNVEITNESEKPSVDIEKTGIIQTTANQEIKYDFVIKNTGNVPLSDFTWYDYLPTDYVRITKLITGTYNQDLNYSIYYKTNKNGYRLL